MALVSTHARPSLAYRTNANFPEISGTERVVWQSSPVTLQVSGHGPGAFTAETTTLALLSAAAQWDAPTCSTLELQVAVSTGIPAATGDGINSVQWLSDGWMGTPDSPGYTDVQLLKDSAGVWSIAEADIYLNSAHPTFTDPTATAVYLQAVLAHELGHVAGLLHPCEVPAAGGAPLCDATNETQLMHPLYGPSRTELSGDEVAGLCFLYPQPPPTTETTAPDGLAVPGIICRNEAQCLDGMHCVGSVCKGGVGELGDPCKHAGDCQSAACNKFCSPACTSDNDCAPGATCLATSGPWGACTGVGQGYGKDCDTAESCMSDYCLSGAAATPICTRPCGDGYAVCPHDWACESLDSGEGAVCAPPLAPQRELQGGGCRMQPQSRSTGFGYLLLTGALIGLSGRLWSRRRAVR